MTTTWNPSDKSANITLSNTNHTMTSGGGSGNEGARATTSKSAGKWYLEYTNIDTGGFGFGAGFGPASASLTGGNMPEFRITGSGGISIPSGGGYAPASNPTGDTVAFALDLDMSPKSGWLQFNGTWYGPAGALGAPPAPGDATGYDLTGATFPWYPTCWLQFNPCTCDINAGDLTFVNAPPAGFNPWDGAVNGNAVGSTMTATVSLIPGTATVHALDGSRIFEAHFREIPGTQYLESDYDSIWSCGDRIANGLIAAGEYGWSHVVQPFDTCFDNSFGNGFEYQNASPQVAGAAIWFTFLNNTAGGFRLEGLRMVGDQTITNPDFFRLVGGVSPGEVYPFSYMAGTDAFSFNQTSSFLPRPGWKFADVTVNPATSLPWNHYEIVFADTVVTAGSRFTNELLLKLNHSILDGGDRRSTNGRPEKRCTITLSPAWFERTGAPYGPLATNALDGDNWMAGDGLTGHVYASTQIGSNAGASNPMSAAGEYIQFVFPRPVDMKHILFQLATGVETYAGPDPVSLGLWHWEVSSNSGVSWETVGTPWSFKENCAYAVAPRTGTFDLAVGDGKTHWRMVLDAGPAFGGGFTINQIMFDLVDLGDQGTFLTLGFTDDTDGTAIPVELGSPGSPYAVAFTDGTDDQLTFTVTNTPNPLLTVAFDDGGTFDTWSDLYPSLVVQTIVNATGRR